MKEEACGRWGSGASQDRLAFSLIQACSGPSSSNRLLPFDLKNAPIAEYAAGPYTRAEKYAACVPVAPHAALPTTIVACTLCGSTGLSYKPARLLTDAGMVFLFP